MRIRIKQALAGPHYAYSRGEQEVPDELAKRLIASGHAEAVRKKAQKATAPRGEVADLGVTDDDEG